MRVAITGFEPFGPHTVNPSQLVAERLGGAILPVSVERAPAALADLLERERPDVVVGLGLAALRTQVSVERVAINVLDFTVPDNDGRLLAGEPVDARGPAAWFATVPVRAIAARWSAEAVPSYLSNTAGTHLCNATLYRALALGAEQGFRAGFIHLPPLEHMDLDRQVHAVEVAIAVIRAEAA